MSESTVKSGIPTIIDKLTTGSVKTLDYLYFVRLVVGGIGMSLLLFFVSSCGAIGERVDTPLHISWDPTLLPLAKIDLASCRLDNAKIGMTTVKYLPPEINEYLLENYNSPGVERQDPNYPYKTYLHKEPFGMVESPDDPALVYVAPLDFRDKVRRVDLGQLITGTLAVEDPIAKAREEAKEEKSRSRITKIGERGRVIVVVAEELIIPSNRLAWASWDLEGCQDWVLIADRIIADNSEFTTGLCPSRLVVFANQFTGEAHFSSTGGTWHQRAIDNGQLPPHDDITFSPPLGTGRELPWGLVKKLPTSYSTVFQLAAQLSDEPLILESLVYAADNVYRRGDIRQGPLGTGFLYTYAQTLINNSREHLPITLDERIAAIEAWIQSRTIALDAGLDFAGLDPQAFVPLAPTQAQQIVQVSLDRLHDLQSIYYLQQIQEKVTALQDVFYAEALEQSVGEVARLRAKVVESQLQEKQYRVKSAAANVQRFESALAAAETELNFAIQNLQGDKRWKKWVDAGLSIASLYEPARDFTSAATTLVRSYSEVVDDPKVGKEQPKEKSKSRNEKAEDVARSAQDLAERMYAAYQALQVARAETPECESVVHCTVLLSSFEAAKSALQAAQADFSAAQHALAAAEANVQLAKAERQMHLATSQHLAYAAEVSLRRAQVFCKLAQGDILQSAENLNMYRRIRKLHDVPLDPDDPAYNSLRYDYLVVPDLLDPGASSGYQAISHALEETMRTAPYFHSAWTQLAPGSRQSSLAALLKESKHQVSSIKVSQPGSSASSLEKPVVRVPVYRVELYLRLEKNEKDEFRLRLRPDMDAIKDAGQIPWLEANTVFSNKVAIQMTRLELWVESENDTVRYSLPVRIERSVEEPITINQQSQLMQSMYLTLGGIQRLAGQPPIDGNRVNILEPESPGIFALDLVPSDMFPWGYPESLEKTWKLSIDVCAPNQKDNCITEVQLESISSANLTVHYRYKTSGNN